MICASQQNALLIKLYLQETFLSESKRFCDLLGDQTASTLSSISDDFQTGSDHASEIKIPEVCDCIERVRHNS